MQVFSVVTTPYRPTEVSVTWRYYIRYTVQKPDVSYLLSKCSTHLIPLPETSAPISFSSPLTPRVRIIPVLVPALPERYTFAN